MTEKHAPELYPPRDPVSYPGAYLELRRIAVLVYTGHLEVWTLLDALAKTQETDTPNTED